MDSYRENGCFTCLCEYFNTVVRVVGVILAIVFWIVGINGGPLVNPEFFYVLFLAIVVSILEGLFLFESCITGCCDRDGCCGKTWTVVLFVDNWKRSIVYGGLSVPCFFWKSLTILAGSALLLLAVMYLLLSMYPKPREELTTEQMGVEREKYFYLNI
ncbi:uncharacterized protein [Apostichopus japonicus]|uniref:uncharacterized protein isoform X2 n=1 Tax=Stichopus japonicus TaxID=307972 RepID=UPI003AB265D0